jgi:serine O-acetyltransferase
MHVADSRTSAIGIIIMKNPISTHWLPIHSKEALQFYLEADKLALGVEERSTARKIAGALGTMDHILRFQRLLRDVEYISNCKTSPMAKLRNAYLVFSWQRVRLRLAFDIPLNVFGPGLSISHYGAVVVNCNARIGAGCRLHNLVHIARKTGHEAGAPIIGDNVFIGPGARILGEITIADGTVIGANSVVTKSVLEPNTTVAGVPARKIGERGTESFWPPGERDALLDYLAANKERFSELSNK